MLNICPRFRCRFQRPQIRLIQACAIACAASKLFSCQGTYP